MNIEKKTYQNVIHYIKDLVKTETLKEGDRLPTERKMSLDLNMSRNSIREALRTMETLGLIESKQGSGNYLKSSVGKAFTETLTMMLYMKKINYIEINQVRCAVEIQAFCSVIQDIKEEQLKKLMDRLIALEAATREDESRYDKEFHHELIAMTKNPLMIGIMEALADAFEDGISYNLNHMKEEERQYQRECHRMIMEGLESKNLKKGLSGIKNHYDFIDQALRNNVLS